MNFFDLYRSDPVDVKGDIVIRERSNEEIFNAVTMGSQFKRSFWETRLNELCRLTQFCHRERSVTHHRLAVTMVEAFGSGDIDTDCRPPARLQRTVRADRAIQALS